jgi:ABC-type antimicrobial peptide transport system permease subunit
VSKVFYYDCLDDAKRNGEEQAALDARVLSAGISFRGARASVRAQGDVSAAARKTVAQIDPGIPVKVSTLDQFHSDAVALPRFRTLVLIVFAGVAAALATAGVYGVMSYAAAQRQAEMGVRIALGASSGDVVSILVGSGARLAAIGLACGLAIALVAGRLIESMLYGIRPQDPLVIGGATSSKERICLFHEQP